MNIPTWQDYMEFRQRTIDQSSSDSPQEENQIFPQLREFVYIDQRSVRSLLASTGSGAIASEQTQREGDVETSEYQGNANIGAPPIQVSGGKKEVSQQSTETENVYSFNLIQSKFTRLYENGEIKPKIKLNGWDEYKFVEYNNFSDVERGDLIEIQGNISLHPLYRIYRTIKYIDNAAPEESDIAEGDLKLIEDSIGNEIPIEVDVDGITVGNNSNIQNNSEGDKFNIVALLDKSELWTEPIQTLASNKQFQLFCRIESVEPNWYPMKLIRVMESISPQLAEDYNTELEKKLQTAMDRIEQSVEGSNESQVNEQIVRDFTEFLSQRSSVSVDDEEIDTIIVEAIDNHSYDAKVAFEREIELLKQTYRAFIGQKSEDLFSKSSEELRSEYREEQAEIHSNDDSTRDFTPHIEVNVIAIYW